MKGPKSLIVVIKLGEKMFPVQPSPWIHTLYLWSSTRAIV